MDFDTRLKKDLPKKLQDKIPDTKDDDLIVTVIHEVENRRE